LDACPNLHSGSRDEMPESYDKRIAMLQIVCN
jgi:hypothetical protein